MAEEYGKQFNIGAVIKLDGEQEFKTAVSNVKKEAGGMRAELAKNKEEYKQWTATIPYIEQKKLDPWVHNKTIQKARESFRILSEQKAYLEGLKV